MTTIHIHNQAEGDRLIPAWLQIEFLPCEVLISPMEGPINLRLYFGFFQCDACQASCFAWDGRSRCCDGNAKPFISRVTVSGGDSPLHPDWVRSLRDQCASVNVPFEFESWGEWAPFSPKDGSETGSGVWLPDGRFVDLYDLTDEHYASYGEFPAMFRVGRSRSGRTLDGRTHDAAGVEFREGESDVAVQK